MTPQIQASEWLNTAHPMTPSDLRGRVVMVTAFQMLCQGCVTMSLPQARAAYTAFKREDLLVIGLHSVFEHHDVMTPAALRAFAHECRLPFPIAIDRAREGFLVPQTMSDWDLEGTPTLLLFDRDGRLALRHFGHMDDLRLGALLGELIARPASLAAPAIAGGPTVRESAADPMRAPRPVSDTASPGWGAPVCRM